MGGNRWARTRAWACAVGLLGALVVPVVAMAPPAAASHTLFSLTVTPATSTVAVGTVVSLTATLAGIIPVTVTDQPISFKFEGGPLAGTPDRTCTVPALSATCSLTVASPVAGSTLVRAVIAGVTADATETETAPGTVAEPDDTDVVRVTWLDKGLDVTPDNQTKARGETASLTATAYDQAGNPSAGVLVKFEFYDGSISDPGGGSTPGVPDRSCTTNAQGTCSTSFAQAADGIDVVCAWVSTQAPTMVGKVTDSNQTCDEESLFDATANDGKPSPADDDQDVVRVIWGAAVPPAPTVPGPGSTTPPAPVGNGYWLVAADGGIFAYGEAAFFGSTGATKLNQPIVGMASTPTRKGYFLVASDGGIFAFGDAVFKGSTGATKLNKPIVGMAVTPSGNGYWLVASDGGIFAFGDATFKGSTGAIKLNQPIVAMAATPSAGGYFMVASDGGIFAFGDATFKGSTGAIKLNQPIVAMGLTPTSAGYFLTASDGGIFAFGDATFRGSTGAIKLNQPIVGMSVSSSGAGYRLGARDGGIFVFGDVPFRGSAGAIKLTQPIVGMSGFGKS